MSRLVPAASLVEDLRLYPRDKVNDRNVGNFVLALEAGAEIPPVVADRKTKIIVDGWHRTRAAIKHDGPDAKIAVDFRNYPDEAAMFADAIALNIHGLQFNAVDHVTITLKAGQLGIPLETVAVVLKRPVETIEKISLRVAQAPDGETVALKRPLARLAGTRLTERQAQANRASSGWSATFHARQLMTLLEANAIIEVTTDLSVTLAHLRDMLIGMDLETEEPAA